MYIADQTKKMDKDQMNYDPPNEEFAEQFADR